MRKREYCLFALTLFLPLSVFSGDWPQFKRTANRQGCDLTEQVALPSKLCCLFDFGSPIRASAAMSAGKAYVISGRGLLARLDLSKNAVDWQVSLGGINNESSPAVENGKVYVGTTAGKFYVLDADSGRVLTTYEAGGAVFASPLLFAGRVYFGSMNGTFHALDLDGNVKWTYTARNYVLHSAAAEDGQILFSDGGSRLYWLRDAGATGEVQRTYHYDPGHSGEFFSSLMIWSNGVYSGMVDQETSGGRRLARFDFATGKFDKNIMAGIVVSSCISVDTDAGFLFFGTAYSGLYGRGQGAGTYGSKQWTTLDYNNATNGIPGVNSAPAVVGNGVIFGSEKGEVHFLEKYSGKQLWSYKAASKKSFDAPVAVSNGKVLIGSLDGCLYGFWDGTEVTTPVKVDPQNAKGPPAANNPASRAAQEQRTGATR